MRSLGCLVLVVALVSLGCSPSAQVAPERPSASGIGDAPVTPAPTAQPTRVPTLTPVPTAPPPTLPAPTATAKAPAPSPTPTPLPVARILHVPIHRQEHALSCEAAALRMALGSLGITVSEQELLAKLARDDTPRRVRADGSVTWGDPELGFVGAWDGVYLRDGYGVYDGPIADLALAYGLSGTTHATGADPARLYAAVRQGFPAVVWVPYGLTVKGRGAWTTPGGKSVPYVVTEHAVVLAGVDEDGVYYADPLQPKLQYASYEAFEAAFAEIDNRAVVLRP